MSQKFYLYKRKNGIYYAELIFEGQRTVCRSTREKNRDKAALIAAKWIAEGIPDARGDKKALSLEADFKTLLKYAQTEDITEIQAVDIARALQRRGLITMTVSQAKQGNKRLIEFLLEYWDYDKSTALQDKRAHGKQVLNDTCYSAKNIINGKWKPYFGEKTLSEISRNDLRDFGLALNRKRLASSTINNTLFYGTLPLKWAYNEKIISENICEGLSRFSAPGRKRDILSDSEMSALADYKYWRSLRGYTAFMLASTSGMRNSEIRALQLKDIGKNLIYIKKSHNNKDGIKKPKNGEERTVYLIPELKDLIKQLLTENPYNESKGIESYYQRQFIFYSDNNMYSPCDICLFPEALKTAIKNAGIDTTGRYIDFHSLRHYCSTKWANCTGDLRQAAKVTGHKTLNMAAKYSDHTTESEMIEMGETAAKILKFRKGA